MMEKNITNKPENSSWLKIKLLQFIGFILIIAAFYLLFSIYFLIMKIMATHMPQLKKKKLFGFIILAPGLMELRNIG